MLGLDFAQTGSARDGVEPFNERPFYGERNEYV